MKYQRLPFCVACATQDYLGPQKLGGIVITLCEDCRAKARGPRSLDHGDKIRSALAKRKAKPDFTSATPRRSPRTPTRSRRSWLSGPRA